MTDATMARLVQELADKFADEITSNYWDEAVDIADTHIAEGDDINWESVAEDVIDQIITGNDMYNGIVYSMWLLVEREPVLAIVAGKLETFNDEN